MSELQSLQGKVAIVTGGGSGIGRAISITFAQAGATVVIANRTLLKAEFVAGEIRADGREALPLRIDVSRSLDIQRMVRTTIEQYGQLDILVNNAGEATTGSVTETSEEEWDRVMATELRSVFIGTQQAIPEMQKQGGGVILNMAGTVGMAPRKATAALAAAKAAVINLTRSIALDYAQEYIRCNALCPSFVDTPRTESIDTTARDHFLQQYQPMPGLIQAEEVASLALYLASDAAKMITGQTFVIDGGQQAGVNAHSL